MTRRVAFAGLAAIVVWFIACTWTGIDFGGHWDEIPTVIVRVAKSIRAGTILPERYLHPALLHDITVITAVASDPSQTREDAARRAESKPFLLRMRRIVAVISSLTIVWVFLLVLAWRESPVEALVAAAIAAGSWELQYHSRWLTVDPLMVQCAALTLCCAVAGYRRQSVWLLRASGVAAGLACGAKYTAGLLLVTVILACWFSRDRVRRVVEAVVLFAAGFIATTPGAVLETRRMIGDVLVQSRIYASGWGAYTVAPGLEHGGLLAQYVGLVLLSHIPLIAAFLTAAAIGGAIVAARDDHRAALIALSFPILYLLYFATRKVMFVRNSIVIVPFLAPLAAIGIVMLIRRGVRTRELRMIVAVVIGTMLVINLAWLWTAARSIRRSPQVYLAQLAAYLDDHSDRRFALSPRVTSELYAFDRRARPVVPLNAPNVDEAVFFALESPSMPFLPNRRDSVECWFGAHEINFNYYPTWITADRILVMKPEKVLWLNRRR